MLLSSGGLSVGTKWKFPFSEGQVEGVAPEIETPAIRLLLSLVGLINLSLGLLWPDVGMALGSSPD